MCLSFESFTQLPGIVNFRIWVKLHIDYGWARACNVQQLSWMPNCDSLNANWLFFRNRAVISETVLLDDANICKALWCVFPNGFVISQRADSQRYWVFVDILWKVDTKMMRDRLDKFMLSSCQARVTEFLLQWKSEGCKSIDSIPIDRASFHFHFKKKTTAVMPETCML